MANTELDIRMREPVKLRIGNPCGGGGNDLSLGRVIRVPEKDYEKLTNKPQINGVELVGDKSSRELKIKESDPLTNLEINEIFRHVFG